MDNSSFILIASLSFMVALTGAVSPGPLLTYTIARSAATPRRGYLVGVWVIAGHALVEMFIVLLLLAGFSSVLKNPAVVKATGLAGGTVLVWMGVSLIKECRADPLSGALAYEDGPGAAIRRGWLKNPAAGGAVVSMANPYWWVWWATIGAAFMTRFNISFENPCGLAAFFIGHEAGDLAWYLFVSTLSFWGIRNVNSRVYSWILGCCGGVMAGFGIYLGISPFV